MNSELIVITIAATVSAAIPILLAALGEVITERAGIINLGLEGMMITGAVSAFLIGHSTGSLVLAALGGIAGGVLLALLHALSTITFRANQIVSGLALVIFGTGLARFLGKPIEGVPIGIKLPKLAIPGLSAIPWVGEIFFNQNILVYLSFVLTLLVVFYFKRTRLGLKHDAIGESPLSADVLGVRVQYIRFGAVLIGGAFSGIAGAYLVLYQVSSWAQSETTAGLGWIAIALVVFSGWRPWRVWIGALIFGLALRGGFLLQSLGISSVPASFISMLPYVLTVIVLILLSIGRLGKGSVGPASLGAAYAREER